MNKEEFYSNVCHYSKVTKDFIVRQYHRFADFLARKRMESRKNGCFVMLGMRFTKFVFILMNIFYLMMALFMIIMGSSSYYALQTFFNVIWLDVQGLSIIWIVSGVLLGFISIFGIIGALKESIVWSNIYGVLLIVTFFLQILTSIAAFCLVATGSSREHAVDMVDYLMRHYYLDVDAAERMDNIQRTLQCCGAENPSDWENIDDYVITYDPFAFVTDSMSTEPSKYRTPASCCDQSRYNSYEDNICNKYYQKGCTLDVSNLAAETVLIVASVLLAIGAFQILGMFSSFMLARMFREASIYRNVQKFSSQYDKVFDVPTYVDYERLHNTNDDVNGN
ncbi:hypothetical protein HA402_014759 [Bradysia odoriphaga]|nr:hypothetical protein HA402_014759 [Bradysia odoriphaga]